MVKLNFDLAAKHVNINTDMLELIKGCNSVLRVSFPLRRDDGSVEVRAPRACSPRPDSASPSVRGDPRTSMRAARTPDPATRALRPVSRGRAHAG